MEQIIDYLKKEQKKLEEVAAKNSRPEIREAWAAKTELYKAVVKQLKAGTDPALVVSMLEGLETELQRATVISYKDYYSIGKRQAAAQLIKILKEE